MRGHSASAQAGARPVAATGAGVGVVLVTRDRRESVCRTLDRLAAVAGDAPVALVDNGSTDGTAAAVRAAHPRVRVTQLPYNAGPAARTIGARALDTPIVAFNDDDSWWAPGALERAKAIFGAYPRLGLLAARILVGPEEKLDPTCPAMLESPLPPEPDLPGPSVLGFVACGTIVRRSAYLSAGGFSPRIGFGGEETLLALDLAAAGWGLSYVDEVVAHHHPPPSGVRRSRNRTEVRNGLWTAWLRRRPTGAIGRTAELTTDAMRRGELGALVDAARGLGWVRRERRPLSPSLERAARAVDRAEASRSAGPVSRNQRILSPAAHDNHGKA